MERSVKFSKDFEVAEIGLTYRSAPDAGSRPTVTSSRSAYEILLKMWDKDTLELQEQFKVLLLNRAGRVLGIYEVSQGSTCGTLVDPKLIFIAALKAAASSIIISHNHPSGNTNPSESDKQLTRKLSAGAKLLDIQLLDHIIVTANGYCSFGDEALL